ncbi:Mov34/MPN/PAD-1 family protein [Myxococcaceae bacterium JPH2]|nr:Mov34/MPN/PAD-1 family protein [Myxococcaceae bacterium JPH2]
MAPALAPDTRVPPRAVIAEVVRHLQSAWPAEGCGVILQGEAPETWRVRPLRNASPTPRTHFEFDLSEWLQVCRGADACAERVACVFHSHVNAPAHFSVEDRERAAPSGTPLLPGVSHLVVAIHGGCVTHLSLFAWESEDFLRVSLSLADFRIEKPV